MSTFLDGFTSTVYQTPDVNLETFQWCFREKCDIDMTPLDSRDLDLAEAMKDKVGSVISSIFNVQSDKDKY